MKLVAAATSEVNASELMEKLTKTEVSGTD